MTEKFKKIILIKKKFLCFQIIKFIIIDISKNLKIYNKYIKFLIYSIFFLLYFSLFLYFYNFSLIISIDQNHFIDFVQFTDIHESAISCLLLHSCKLNHPFNFFQVLGRKIKFTTHKSFGIHQCQFHFLMQQELSIRRQFLFISNFNQSCSARYH